MECVYIHTTKGKDQTFLTMLPPPASSVFQPDSWFSVDAGVLAAAQPGRQEAAWSGWPGGGLREADHSWRTPHLDGGVVAGGQQQLLVGGAERHRVHHIVVCQTGQTDVVVTVPDVAVLVLGSTGDKVSADVQEDEEALIVGCESSMSAQASSLLSQTLQVNHVQVDLLGDGGRRHGV